MAKIHRSKLQGLPSYFQSWGLKSFADDAAFVTAKGSAAVAGDTYWNITDSEVRSFNGTAWVTVITADASGNVIIDGNLTVQGTETVLNTATLDVEDVNITINNGGNQASADDAAGITVEMSDAQDVGLIYDKDVASRFKIGDTNALKEVADVSSTQALTNKTVVVASNTVTTAASGNLTATELNAALSELQSDIDTRALASDLSDHISDAVDAHDASAISFVNTTSGLAATTAQAALDEIDGDLDAHIGNTSNPHAVTATQVGLGNVDNTSDATKNSAIATLTNKSIDADANTITNIENADIKAGAAIDRAKLASGTASHVLINDGSGVMSSEAQLAKSRGGAGADMTSVTFPSSGTIVTEAGTQTLSGKSISDALTFSHITTPSNPAASALKIYVKNDDKLYKLNSAGEEVEIGSGAGGSGGKNYFDNPDFETNIDGVTTFNDGGTYTDGTGGSVTALSVARNATTPLSGTGDLKISKITSSATGEGVTLTTRALDRSDYENGRNLTIQFEWDGTDVDYTDGDLVLQVYSTGTDATILPVTPMAGLNEDGSLPALKTKVVAYVPLNTNSDGTLRVSLHIPSDSATGADWDVYIDDFKIGPDGVVPGAIITDWESFTPTGSWTSGVTYSGKKRRVGSSLEHEVTITVTGAISPSATTLTIDLPDGLSGTISDGVTNFGNAWLYDLGTAANRVAGYVSANASVFTNVRVFAHGSNLVTDTAPFTWASGDTMRLRYTVPIEGWSATATVSTTELALQTVYALASTSAGQSIPNNVYTVIDYDTVSSDKFSMISGSGASWKATAKQKGLYQISANAILTASTGWEIGEIAALKVTRFNSAGTTLEETFIHYHEVYSSDASAASTYMYLSGSPVFFEMAADDYVQVRLYQNSDADIALFNAVAYNNFSMHRIPDFSVFGAYSEKNKVQTKYLSADVTTNTTMSDLTFSNLTIGKWYELTGQFRGRTDNAAADAELTVDINHNSAVIGKVYMLVNEAADTNVDVLTFTPNIKFKATATTLTFSTGSASANSHVQGDGSASETWVQLEERNDLIETSGW